MSNWHQFDVHQYDLRDADVELRDLYKQTHRWLTANAAGKWKITCLRRGGSKRIPIKTFLKFFPIGNDRIIVSLKKERDVTLFKVFFEHYREVTPPSVLARVILPMIRRVAMAALVNEIVGVQPMTGPVGQVFGMKVGYVDQNNPNNRMFRGSPSQRRAARRRLRDKGVLTIQYFRSDHQIKSLRERYGR